MSSSTRRETRSRIYWERAPQKPRPTSSPELDRRPLLCDRDQLMRVPRDVLEDMAEVPEIPRA
eukprot:3958119-Pyramimonas_sp.AAC.1